MQTYSHIVEVFTTVLVAASMVYCLLTLVAAWSFLRAARRAGRASGRLPDGASGVSILKPVKGFEEGMYEAFRGHCLLEYAGSHELIFGAEARRIRQLRRLSG